jgi:hypothetical protein
LQPQFLHKLIGKSDMMAPETKLELRALFKKVALVCVLLGFVMGLCLYFVADPSMQLLVMVLAALAAGGSGYYLASIAPLWVAMPWLKGLLCVLAILAGTGIFAVVGAVSLIGYAVVTGKTSSAGSRGGFSSWD